jgi:hypothetical protein
VGTLYRYRSQVLFVPIIWIAADQVRREWEAKKKREAARPKPLRRPVLVPVPNLDQGIPHG